MTPNVRCPMHMIRGSSKALLMFEDDPRFLAVEKDREREELFEDYMVDLERKVCAFSCVCKITQLWFKIRLHKLALVCAGKSNRFYAMG